MKLFIFLVFFSSISFATEDCLEITEKQMEEWMKIQPELPSFAHLIKAKKIIDAESKYALKLGNDKTAHCYLGCRISESVNFETAKFTAWQKEYNDATDCNSKTKFEVADYGATIKGAERSFTKTANKCATYCKQLYKK